MKAKILALPALALSVLAYACNRTADARYVDLSTGEEVELVKDEETGLLVHAETRKPVHIYVDTKTNDTIYGSTGKVINGHIDRDNDGVYRYSGEYKYKDDANDVKVKVEDGEYKYKSDDVKIKIDEDGRKVKYDD